MLRLFGNPHGAAGVSPRNKSLYLRVCVCVCGDLLVTVCKLRGVCGSACMGGNKSLHAQKPA